MPRPRIKTGKPIATSSKRDAKQLSCYQTRKHHIEVMQMKHEKTKHYYVKFLGELKEISEAEIPQYEAGGFKIIVK